jgi:hypothetical protein
VAETSLLKMLAGKHRSSVAAMARKYKATTETANGPRKCLKVVVQRGSKKKPLIALFGGIPLKRKRDAILVDPSWSIEANSSDECWRIRVNSAARKKNLNGSSK